MQCKVFHFSVNKLIKLTLGSDWSLSVSLRLRPGSKTQYVVRAEGRGGG